MKWFNKDSVLVYPFDFPFLGNSAIVTYTSAVIPVDLIKS